MKGSQELGAKRRMGREILCIIERQSDSSTESKKKKEKEREAREGGREGQKEMEREVETHRGRKREGGQREDRKVTG